MPVFKGGSSEKLSIYAILKAPPTKRKEKRGTRKVKIK